MINFTADGCVTCSSPHAASSQRACTLRMVQDAACTRVSRALTRHSLRRPTSTTSSASIGCGELSTGVQLVLPHGLSHARCASPVQPTAQARTMARTGLDWTLSPAGRPRAAPLPRSAYADGSRRSNSQISLKSRACCAVCAAGAGRSLCADRCAECCADPAGRPRAAPLPRSAYADGSQCSELPIALENRV